MKSGYLDAVFVGSSITPLLNGFQDYTNLILLIIGILTGLMSLIIKYRQVKQGATLQDCTKCPILLQTGAKK